MTSFIPPPNDGNVTGIREGVEITSFPNKGTECGIAVAAVPHTVSVELEEPTDYWRILELIYLKFPEEPNKGAVRREGGKMDGKMLFIYSFCFMFMR